MIDIFYKPGHYSLSALSVCCEIGRVGGVIGGINVVCDLVVIVFLKGGGPYGQEVTRGQDLTGKDFSGKTLIKQDFKTV